jgi:hypothetical protein
MRRLLSAVALTGMVIACWGLLSILVTAGAALTNACQQDGPFSPAAGPADVSFSEQRISVWPLGRECEWIRSDGKGFVRTNSGSAAGTSLAYGSLTIGLILFTTAAIVLSERNRMDRSGAAQGRRGNG